MEHTPAQLARLRLQAQQLVGAGASTPVEAARNLLAMQGQDFAAVRWAIGARVRGCTLADVDAAFDRGELVRSWPMRGTLHVVAAEDLPWLLELAAPRMFGTFGRRYAQLGLDDATLDRARNIAVELLRGGGRASRAELLAAWEAAGIDTSGQRGIHMIGHLAQRGVLAQGPIDGSAQSFVLLDEWITDRRTPTHDEALGELVLRYLHGHGPATLHDVGDWSKLTMRDLKAGLERVRERLVELTCDTRSWWMVGERYAACDPDDHEAASSLLALPAFDEYLLGYRDRSLVVPAGDADHIAPGSNGLFLPTLVAAGTVVGVWRRRVVDAAISIEPAPFRPLSRRMAARLPAAFEPYGTFYDASVHIADAPGESTRR